jgi:hypothetical protein
VQEGLAEKEARAYVRSMQAKEDALGELLAAKRERPLSTTSAVEVPSESETCDASHVRFLASRGETTRSDSGYRLAEVNQPHIGPKPIAAITRDDIETVRDALDAAIREPPSTDAHEAGSLLRQR